MTAREYRRRAALVAEAIGTFLLAVFTVIASAAFLRVPLGPLEPYAELIRQLATVGFMLTASAIGFLISIGYLEIRRKRGNK